jgi:hypothetical protein
VTVSDYSARVRRAGLAIEAHERELKLREKRRQQIEGETSDAPEAKPPPTARPSKRAQWDELRGAWVEWDPEANEWREVTAEPDGDG